MMKTNKFILPLAAAAVVGSLGVTEVAQAKYMVVIDCRGNEGAPSWAYTRNTIKAEALVKGRWYEIDRRSFGPYDCLADDSWKILKEEFDMGSVKGIRVTTDGYDAFWVDKGYLTDGVNAYRTVQFGTDNNVGWCVSRSASDGAQPYCADAKAYTTKEWTW